MPAAKTAPRPIGLAAQRAALEREQLRAALSFCASNRVRAAAYLGVSPKQVHAMLLRWSDIAREFPARHGRPPKVA